MFKKINQQLLLKYPQLWNTRIVWAILVIGIIHCLFFIAGYLHFDSYEKLHSPSLSGNVIYSYNVGFSILISLLCIIIWLVFYFRNNPFKSFYPLPKTYFFTEFCIIFFVVLSSVTFYKSFATGFWLHVKNSTADVDLKSEERTLNLAYGLIPSDCNRYKIQACCDSIKYIDSLRAFASPINRDSFPIPGIDSAIARFEEREEANTNYSYLNYCNQFYFGFADTLNSKEEVSATIQQWLTSGNRQAVRELLQRFDKMSIRYKVYNNINVTDYNKTIFADSDFHIRDFIRDGGGPIYDDGDTNKYKSYFAFNDVTCTLRNIYLSRYPYFDIEFWIFNLFLALLAAIAIFTFRLTSVRVWLISLVGAGVIVVTTSLVCIAVRNETSIGALLLAILVSFYALYFIFRASGKKLLTALNLVWFSWALSFAGFVTWNMLRDIFRPITTYNAKGDVLYQSSPFYDFLGTYENARWLAYIIVVFLFVSIVLWRNYRSWLAMPEE